MILYLCEKPSQARDIALVLGATNRRDGYLEGQGKQVTWCVGHLLEMWMPDQYKPEWRYWRMENLPILPDHWQLAVRDGGAKQFAIIQRLLKRADEVIIATDADREGETIGREVLVQCGYGGPVQRLWLSALDDASIRKALAALLPGEKTQPLFQAGLGRARADWLVGMNLSRAYTLLGKQAGYDGVLTVGRVQTPTLKLVVERDRQIEQFKPVAYFDLRVQLQVAGGSFWAKWLPDGAHADDQGRCLDQAYAQQVALAVDHQWGTIQKAETKREKEPPPLPLELSTLQQEASRRWSLGAQKTLDVAQSLYESHKAITYPRTDCRYLPNSQFGEAAAILSNLATMDATLAPLVTEADSTLRSRAWDDKKITAHHAIIPTSAPIKMQAFSLDEARIYDLIRRHYLAQFYPAFEFDRTVVECLVVQESFRATGRVVKIQGWKKVIQEVPKSEEEEGEQTLPAMTRGEAAEVVASKLEEKRTKPPLRYTEGTLIQAMKNVGKNVADARLRQILRETSGIGTEATRAAIIENLLKRQLLKKEGKKNIISSEAGRMLVDLLPHSVTDPATTAVWEQTLDDIAHGRSTLDEFLAKAVLWVNRLIHNVKARGPQAIHAVNLLSGQSRQEDGKPENRCPQCGSPLTQRVAKSGPWAGSPFLGCRRYPQCRYVQKRAG